MHNGTVVITGGSGFLGVGVAKALLAQDPARRIVLIDLVEHPRLASLRGRVEFVKADLGDAAACAAIISRQTGTVYHFASLVSGGAERDFVAGLQANVFLTINLLEACRTRGACPRFVFTSSIATFGGSRLPSTIDDWTHQHPQNSYGVAKVVGEQLLNDYSRKGYIDGRGVRLAAIIVRDEPNTAASGYLSALIREPLAGKKYLCPVSPDTAIPVLSNQKAVEVLLALGELAAGKLGDFRTINSPSLSPSAGQIAEAAQRTKIPAPDAIRFAPDAQTMAMISGWPKVMLAERARALGLSGDASIDAIIRDYRAELR